MPTSNILILPAGCLNDRGFALQSKAPEDARFYQISLANRMLDTDTINTVKAFPNDETITIDEITSTKQIFKCRMAGGKLNTKVGIRFIVTTQMGETHSFVCTLPIMQQGILTETDGYKVILGTNGPKGEKGDKGDPGQQGDPGPQGEKGDKSDKGDTGPQGIQGVQGLKGDTGERGLKGEKGDQGDKGDRGEKGVKGDVGPPGPQGLKGDTGQQGIKAE